MSRFVRLIAGSLLTFCAACSSDDGSETPDTTANSSNAMDMSASTNSSNSSNNTNSLVDTGFYPDASDASADAAVDMFTGPRTVPVFVAQGDMSRLMVSCDDGQTWTANTSTDDTVRCFVDDYDCNHHPGAGRGVGFQNGTFVATFGWGAPVTVQRSRNGVDWTPTHVTEGNSGASSVTSSGNVWVAGFRNAMRSLDDGLTWTEVNDSALVGWNVRRSGWVPYQDEGRFILVADGEVSLSSDDGETWWQPTSWPDGCGSNIQWSGGIAGREDILVIASGDGTICRSTDGGATWDSSNVGANIDSHLLATESEFVTFNRGNILRSTDGQNWTSSALEPAGLNLEAIARNPDTGTYVGVRGGWQTWYESQEFYRSADGVTWDVLPTESYVGSHPIRFMAFGNADPSTVCP